MRKKKNSTRRGVVLSGAYGMDNAGDEAVLTAIVDDLRSIDRLMPITVLSRKPRQTAQALSVTAYHPFFQLGRWLAALGRAKLFCSGGGTLLQDVTSRRSLWFYAFTIRTAYRRGCAVQLYGCGLGPFCHKRSAQRTARLLNCCVQAITVRDRNSLALLHELGVTRPQIFLAADPALRPAAPPPQRERRLELVLRPWTDFFSHAEAFAAAVRYAYETYRLVPEFLCLAPQDEEAAQTVAAALGGDIPWAMSRDLQRLPEAALVLSMRLHGLIFALNGQTPAAGVSYDPKVTAFCREAGFPQIAWETITAEALCHLLDDALTASPDIQASAAQALLQRQHINRQVAAGLLADRDG
jgi:polysaccharide pyruvyl transferase CsaB